MCCTLTLHCPAESDLIKKTPNEKSNPYLSGKSHSSAIGELWPPIASWFLPGIDQMIEGQYSAALIYGSTVIAADHLALVHTRNEIEYQYSYEYRRKSRAERLNHSTFGLNPRKAALYSQVSLATRSMSAYHSFQTAVTNNKKYGRYEFIKHQDSPLDISLAPFEFSFLTRANTSIPLGMIAIYAITGNTYFPENILERRKLNSNDYLFATSASYLAGTHEEAMFRGWIMPALHQATGSAFWSNSLTSLIFARAHYPNIELPLPQLLLGWHLGRVVNQNDYSLKEAIFIHTWWDIFAFLSAYKYREKESLKSLKPILRLPPLLLTF